jgi:hypothetical protein
MVSLVVLCLFFFISGCGHELYKDRSVGGSVCDLSNFDGFWRLFSKSVDFQKKHTLYPFQKLYVDKLADPEPLPREVSLMVQDDVAFPLYPVSESVDNITKELHVQISRRKAKVRISKLNTDFLVNYYFKHDQCWGLYRIEDWSL